MIHEAVPTVTETVFGSHPCCVVSVTYVRSHCFHGGNTGSNPVGDAKHSKRLKLDLASSFHVTVCNVKPAAPVTPLFSAQSFPQPSIAPCVSHPSLLACRRPS